MKVKEEKTFFKSVMALVLVTTLFVGCAKELPEDVSDDIRESAHAMSLFGSPVVVASNDEEGTLALQSKDEVSDIVAVNEIGLRSVSLVSGPSELAPFFEKLKLESSFPGEKFTVHFAFNSGSLVAYAEVKNQKVSLINSQLTSTVKTYSGSNVKAYPIFQYSVQAFGVLERAENSLGEETRTVIFSPKTMSSATHIKIDPKSEFRKEAALRFNELDEVKVIFNKQKLETRLFKKTELVSLFTRSSEFEATSTINNNEFLKVSILEDKILIQKPVLKSSLNTTELAILTTTDSDPRVKQCDDRVAEANGINLEECFLKPIYSVGIKHIELKKKMIDGIVMAEMDSPSVLTKTFNSKLIEIDLDSNLLDARIDDTEIVFSKDDLNSKIYTSKEIETLFNYKASSEAKVMKILVLKKNMVIQRPVKLSSLTQLELAALKAGNDPRIKKCDAATAKAAGINENKCVLKPEHSLSVKHIRLKKPDNADSLNIQTADRISVTDHRRSQYVEIDLSQRTTDSRVGGDLTFNDEILTTKSRHFDTKAEYLYVPMTMGTPREVVAADPFYQGKEKIVKMKFVEDGLEIYELEKDDRFTDNDLNNAPVLKITGKHIDFKCKQDDNDECIGGDVEDNEKDWNQKRFFKPSLDNLKILEINPLDVMTVEADSCLQKVNTELVSHTIKKGVLNIELEKTYKTSNSWRCIQEHYFTDTENMTGFTQAGFKVRFFYSIVKLDDLASKDYEPVAYPIPDHDEFGFFKDKISKLSSDFDRQRKENNYRLNRWNPKKKVITYHLSDTFDKPKNKLIKDATYKAFEGMNRSLKMANAGLQLELVEPSGKKSGDLRNSMIVLIDDPLSNGLLGYAPTVTNPRTGEIVQGHVNMYSGVLTSIVRQNWEGMVDFTIEKSKEEKKLESLKSIQNEKMASSDKNSDKEENDADKTKLLKKITNKKLIQKALLGGNNASGLVFGSHNHNHDHGHLHNKVPTDMAERLEKNTLKAKAAMKRRLSERQVRVSDRDDSLEHLDKFQKLALKKKRRLERFAENNALSAEAYKIAHTVKKLIPGIKEIKGAFNEDGTLKRWKDLTVEQKKQATDIIVPYTYSATLVHEVGHGLGLRHNFIASKDAANYWTEEEAKALGLEHAPAYSSVMDYAFDSLNESTIFGKYDIAAIRFGYAREVQVNRKAKEEEGELPQDVKATEFVKVETTLKDLSAKIEATNASNPAVEENLSAYQFCTDSNAGLSASCNRFDEGSTLVEIVNHYISKYENNYKYRNFRDGRDTFQAEGIGGYAIARYNEFNRIRGIFEEWEFFAGIFGEDIMIQGCGPAELKLYPICKDINERRDAVKIAGDFFLKVIKTPDHTCALAKAEAPEVIVESKTLFSIYDDIKFSTDHVTKTCFDPAVKAKVAEDGFIVVGEAGKFLNGFKDNSDVHIYSNDRAVRGVWVDKIFALKALVQRTSGRGTTETNHMAMVDHTGLAPKVGNLLRHLILGEDLVEPVLFKKEDGSLFEHKYAIDLDYTISGPQRGVAWLAQFFNMATSGSSKLLPVLLSNAKQFGLTYGEEHGQASHDIVNLFTVRKFRLGQARDLTDLEYIMLDDTIFAANETNALASIMISNFKTLEFLKTADQEVILKVIENRVNPTLPDGLSEVEVESLGLDIAFLNSLLGAAEANANVELAFLVDRFGEELGNKLFNAFKLGVDGLKKLIAIKESLGQAPDLATELELKLYDMELEELMSFMDGTLEEKTKYYEQTLPYLPGMVHFR